MSCIMHQCTFAFFVTKHFYYSNLIWVCDLSVLGDSPCFGPAIWELPSDFQTKSYFAFLQRLPSLEVFCREGCSWRSWRFRGVAPLLQSLLNKAASLRACGFVEGRIQQGYFSCVICEIFESIFFDEHLATTASDSLNFDIQSNLHITNTFGTKHGRYRQVAVIQKHCTVPSQLSNNPLIKWQ